jgi:hypothetical protein
MSIPSIKDTPDAFHHENRLLIEFLHEDLSEAQLNTIKKRLQGPLNWDYIVNRSHHHRITPIVYAAMKRHGMFESAPAGVQDTLRKAYLGSLATNMAYLEELETILSRFNDAHIKSMIVKGPALAQGLYEDPGLRPFSDIDILVDHKDMESIANTMGELGYQVSEDYRPLDYYEKYHFHHIYLKETEFMSYVVEIHWDLFTSFSSVQCDLGSLFENKMVLHTNGCALTTLSWDDHFLYLCAAHCHHHVFGSLLYFSDLMRIARNKLKENSWVALEKQAACWGVDSALAGCIQVLNSTFGTSLPFPTNNPLKKTQRVFIDVLSSEKYLIQQDSTTDWTFKVLVRIFLFKQKKFLFIKQYLFPGEKDLYEHFYHLPDKTTFTQKASFFLMGCKALTHIGLSFLKICFLSLKIKRKIQQHF